MTLKPYREYNNTKDMKVEQLIEELQKLPAGTEVAIYDGRKNYSHEDGDGSSAGFYGAFEVVMHDSIQHTDGATPVAVLSFENEDYNDDGNLVHCLYVEALDTISDLQPQLGGERS